MKGIILAGSQAEYGPQQSENKTSETTQMMPNTQYGIEKKHLIRSENENSYHLMMGLEVF